jgi:hypothetical protein
MNYMKIMLVKGFREIPPQLAFKWYGTPYGPVEEIARIVIAEYEDHPLNDTTVAKMNQKLSAIVHDSISGRLLPSDIQIGNPPVLATNDPDNS